MQPPELGNVTNIARGTDINWIQINQHPHQDKFYHIFAETVSTQNWKDGMNLENFSALQWYEGMTKTDELTSKIQWILDMCGCGVMLDNCLCFIFYLLFLKWAPFLQWEDWLLLSSGRQMLLETSTGSCQHKLRCYDPRTRGKQYIGLQIFKTSAVESAVSCFFYIYGLRLRWRNYLYIFKPHSSWWAWAISWARFWIWIWTREERSISFKDEQY